MVGLRGLLLLGRPSTSRAGRSPGIPLTPQWLVQTRTWRTPCFSRMSVLKAPELSCRKLQLQTLSTMSGLQRALPRLMTSSLRELRLPSCASLQASHRSGALTLTAAVCLPPGHSTHEVRDCLVVCACIETVSRHPRCSSLCAMYTPVHAGSFHSLRFRWRSLTCNT